MYNCFILYYWTIFIAFLAAIFLPIPLITICEVNLAVLDSHKSPWFGDWVMIYIELVEMISWENRLSTVPEKKLWRFARVFLGLRQLIKSIFLLLNGEHAVSYYNLFEKVAFPWMCSLFCNFLGWKMKLLILVFCKAVSLGMETGYNVFSAFIINKLDVI